MYTSPSGKSYIGQTIYEKTRKCQHLRSAFRYNSQCTFHKAIRKYGIENFQYIVLHSGIDSKKELNRLEEVEIFIRNTMSPHGYNDQSGGESQLLSAETIAKISKANTGKRRTPEQRAYMSSKRRGVKLARPRTEEYKAKLSRSTKGIPKSESAKQKIRIARTNSVCPWGYQQVICMDYGWIFESIKLAAFITGISRSNISVNCKGETNSAGKLHWAYYEGNNKKYQFEHKEHSNHKKVMCIETGKVYNTLTLASIEIGVSSQHLGAVCLGKKKIAKGKHWKYV